MRFFLNTSISVLFITLILVFWLIGFYWFSLPLLLIYLIILLFSRRLSPAFKEDGTLKKGIFYSPVNGRLVQKTDSFQHPTYGTNCTELVIVSSWWREHGIYFPMKSEVDNLSYIGNKGHFRYWYKSHFIKGKERQPSLVLGMSCSNAASFGIEFYKCPFGFWPKLIIIPGDRGKAQVNMGFFGMGGTTVVYLPSEYEVTAKEGMTVIAGQTILARTTEHEKVD